jgi:hypothetical protein
VVQRRFGFTGVPSGEVDEDTIDDPEDEPEDEKPEDENGK